MMSSNRTGNRNERTARDIEARKQLFSASTGPSNIRKRAGEQRAQDVTESLLELRGLLHSQVKSSEETMINLFSSSSQVTNTKTEMEGIGSDTKIAKSLISKYERREITDRVLILSGLILFIGVVLYIIQKRLLGWLW